jgi:phosphopantothenoylcysteine decarboxylase/phosphopantothenate--cysteine ligase
MEEAMPRIVLGVTGGIAAYKSADLVRRLREGGAEVRVVMTRAAREFVTPLTFQALSGHPVREDLFDAAAESAMGHIELARWADLVLIAPATADCMARLAAGLADDLLTTLCLATGAPLVLAPAMNHHMWAHPATLANREILANRGVRLLGPAVGDQACGEHGPGRMLEPGEIAAAVLERRTTALEGRRFVVTAGPTREDLDPVRYLGNRSSGRMGFAVAEAASAAGAHVTLIAGPVALATPSGVERVDVRSALEMRSAVMEAVARADVFVGVAAVADYRPAERAPHKLKRDRDHARIDLIANPDIIAEVAGLEPRPLIVGFAAETTDLVRHARDKLSRKRLDMIAANLVGRNGCGFEAEENEILLVTAREEKPLGRSSKRQLAAMLIDEIAARLDGKEDIETRSDQDS